MLEVDPGDGGRKRPLPTITVFQPWATLIAENLKPWELRKRPAPRPYVNQRVAIHAAARPVRVSEVRQLLVDLQGKNWQGTALRRERAIPLLERVMSDPTGLPMRSVVCTATLGPSICGTELAVQLGVPDVNDSDRWNHAIWGWPLHNVLRVIPPAPAVGLQGWWFWSPPWDGPQPLPRSVISSGAQL